MNEGLIVADFIEPYAAIHSSFSARGVRVLFMNKLSQYPHLRKQSLTTSESDGQPTLSLPIILVMIAEFGTTLLYMFVKLNLPRHEISKLFLLRLSSTLN